MTEQQQPFRGPQTPSTGPTEEEEIAAAHIANRFDIRRIIGGLFVLYVWTGLAMLVFGGLMIFWALARPVAPEPEATRGRGSGRIRRSPTTWPALSATCGRAGRARPRP
jgi:hypothetical protein